MPFLSSCSLFGRPHERERLSADVSTSFFFSENISHARIVFCALATLRVGVDAMAKCQPQSSRERSKAP